jgi:hypothetical protein
VTSWLGTGKLLTFFYSVGTKKKFKKGYKPFLSGKLLKAQYLVELLKAQYLVELLKAQYLVELSEMIGGRRTMRGTSALTRSVRAIRTCHKIGQT